MEPKDQDLLQDIRDRTIRLETKMDSVNEVKKEVKYIRTTADTAFHQSEQNEKEIKRISKSLHWIWQSFITAVVAMLLWLLQHEIYLK